MLIVAKLVLVGFALLLAAVGGMMAEELNARRGALPIAPPAMSSLIFALGAALVAALVALAL